MGQLLRWVRIVASILCFGLLMAMLCSVGGFIPTVGKWLEKVQLLPAILGFAVAIFIVWVIATLLFGRIYCSTICPLGFFQDIFGWYGHRKRHYRHHEPSRLLRYGLIILIALTLMAGVTLLARLLDPYGLFSRFVVDWIQPFWSWLFTPSALVWGAASATGLTLSLGVMLLIAVISYRRGRLVCNTVCPVGTTLGFVSRYSILHIDINTDLCTHCGRCNDVCKAECISLTDCVVDGSRCVVCFDCTASCPNNAITYTYRRHRLAFPLMIRTSGLSAAPTTMESPKSCSAEVTNHKTV